jgi:hypothetical protein
LIQEHKYFVHRRAEGAKIKSEARFSFFDKGRFLEVAAFHSGEQLRYNGVRKVRAVQPVRVERMSVFIRKIAKCCKTKEKLWGL